MPDAKKSDPRELMSRAIQVSSRRDEGLAGALLTSWVLIAEWADDEGEGLFLSKMSDNHSAPWKVKGMLKEVLDDYESFGDDE